jgi:sugar phosphate permease
VNVPVLLLLQHHTADHVRGRVVAATESCEQVAFLIGMGIAAIGISTVHPQQAYAITGGAAVLGTLFAVRAVSSVHDGAVGQRPELAPEVERA